MIYVLIVESDPGSRAAAEEWIRTPTCQTVSVAEAAKARGALSGISFDIMVVGLSPNSPNLGDLIFFAKAKYPTLRIIAGAKQALDTQHARIVDSYLESPITPQAVGAAMRIACRYIGTRLRR